MSIAELRKAVILHFIANGLQHFMHQLLQVSTAACEYNWEMIMIPRKVNAWPGIIPSSQLELKAQTCQQTAGDPRFILVWKDHQLSSLGHHLLFFTFG